MRTKDVIRSKVNSEKIRKRHAGYGRLNPEKTIARYKVRMAIYKEELVRASQCEHCDRERFTYGHHEDYNRPLDVIWLCQRCHSRLHAAKNRRLELSNGIN